MRHGRFNYLFHALGHAANGRIADWIFFTTAINAATWMVAHVPNYIYSKDAELRLITEDPEQVALYSRLFCALL